MAGALLGVAALALVAACGTSAGTSGSAETGSGAFTPPDIPMKKSMGTMEGKVNILAWPGLRRGRLERQDRRLGDPLREEDRVPGQREVLRPPPTKSST